MIEREMGGPQGDHPHSPRRVYASLPPPALTRSRFRSILLYCHTSGDWLLEETQWKWSAVSMFLSSNQSAPSSLPLKHNIEEAFIRKGRRYPLLLGNHKKNRCKPSYGRCWRDFPRNLAALAKFFVSSNRNAWWEDRRSSSSFNAPFPRLVYTLQAPDEWSLETNLFIIYLLFIYLLRHGFSV